jgi:hypothetical protein
MKIWTILVALLLFNAVVLAAPKPASEPSALEDRVLPELNLDNVSLDDAVSFLRDVTPGFNAVIVRDPGVAKDYPVLHAVKLKNITVGQFLDFLNASFPGIAVQRIDGPTPVYSIHITKNDQNLMGDDANAVVVYHVDKIILKMAQDQQGSNTKRALDDLVAMLHNALVADSKNSKALLQADEPTQTILFKGTREENALIANAIKNLMPAEPDTSELTIASLRRDLNDAQGRVRNLQDQLLAAQVQIAVMRSQGNHPPTTKP